MPLNLSSVCSGFSKLKSVETVQSHGDFQPANILVPTDTDQRAVYLIDWEYTARRCRWYDALVFGLRSRSPKGLAARISDWLFDHEQAFQSISWSGLKRPGFIPDFVLASFLMEDLLFRLDDTNVPGLLQPNVGFLTFVDELSAAQIELTQ